MSVAIERLSLAHEQSFLRYVGRKAVKRTQKKPRHKPMPDAIVALADIALPALDLTDAPAEAALPIAHPEAPVFVNGKLNGKHIEQQPRWQMLSRLTRHWQTAVGRTRRAG